MQYIMQTINSAKKSHNLSQVLEKTTNKHKFLVSPKMVEMAGNGRKWKKNGRRPDENAKKLAGTENTWYCCQYYNYCSD